MLSVVERPEIAVAPTPLAELPANALRVAVGFCSPHNLDYVSIRPGDDGYVVVTGASIAMAAEVTAVGQATTEVLLPGRPLLTALRRLSNAEHASIVIAEDGLMATVRLYEPTATLASQMPVRQPPSFVLPQIDPGPQEPLLLLSGHVLSAAAAQLKQFGELEVRMLPSGWLLTCSDEEVSVRCMILGIRRDG